MTQKKDFSQYRNSLFRHLDGIVTAPSAYELYSKGVTDYLLEKKKVALIDITKKFKANEGYLNVALHTLCSQGWLSQHIDNTNNTISYEINEKSGLVFPLFKAYRDVVELMRLSTDYHYRRIDVPPFLTLESIVDKYKNNYGFSKPKNELEESLQQQILKHLEGIVLGPTLVNLSMNGMFHKYFMQASFKSEEFHEDPKNFERLLDILVYFEIFEKSKNTYRFTEKGLFFAKRASAYGVTVSYIPTLRKLDDLIFGNPTAAKEAGDGNKEGHVDRAMNVWGSGGAHSSYFKVVDQIIIDLFNKPIEQQPKGILDMGCGNGAFLTHLFEVIEHQTLRGRHLDEHPLILVGADYNEAALKITKANLIQADIWAKVVWGDIGDPDRLAADLKEDYGVALGDLLNVRSFLDHNRIWKQPSMDVAAVSASTGAFVYEGVRLSNNAVEASLAEHFKAWAPYTKKFGLLLIELHTVPPAIVAKNLGRSAVTAYNATHGYSDQYIVEAPIFEEVLDSIGLHKNDTLSRKFPDSELATVTVNLFGS